ncbi:hypothetical protein BC938DRAFT_478433 [Jimgerdemannia flammicorona]|uniref:Uncharacterized protein n=1 Tax=Jimgerdemannia flammicorona TaxID=994334 RepID=A0A433QYC0_9FUNG|nr:hypothetical protein BC938DRAFT_478433 [Jimgerdemannia flammicorona]
MLTLEHIVDAALTLERADNKVEEPQLIAFSDDDEYDYVDEEKENRAPMQETEEDSEADMVGRSIAVDNVLKRVELTKHLRSLKTRLKFAQFKLENGWEARSLTTVETLWRLKQLGHSPGAPLVNLPRASSSVSTRASTPSLTVPGSMEVSARSTPIIAQQSPRKTHLTVPQFSEPPALADNVRFRHYATIPNHATTPNHVSKPKQRRNDTVHADAHMHLIKTHGLALARKQASAVQLSTAELEERCRLRRREARSRSAKRDCERRHAINESRVLQPLPAFEERFQAQALNSPHDLLGPFISSVEAVKLPAIANALNFDVDDLVPDLPSALASRQHLAPLTPVARGTACGETVSYDKKRKRDPSIASAVSASSSESSIELFPPTPPTGAVLLELPVVSTSSAKPNPKQRLARFRQVAASSTRTRKPFASREVDPSSPPPSSSSSGRHDSPQDDEGVYPLTHSSHCRSGPGGIRSSSKRPVLADTTADFYEPPFTYSDILRSEGDTPSQYSYPLSDSDSDSVPAYMLQDESGERYVTASGELLSSPTAAAAQTIMMFVKSAPRFKKSGSTGWEEHRREGGEWVGVDEVSLSPGIYEEVYEDEDAELERKDEPEFINELDELASDEEIELKTESELENGSPKVGARRRDRPVMDMW